MNSSTDNYVIVQGDRIVAIFDTETEAHDALETEYQEMNDEENHEELTCRVMRQINSAK